MRTAWTVTMILATCTVWFTWLGNVEAQQPTNAEIITQMLDVLERLNKSLATIESQETADAAKPELKKLAAEWTDIREKAEKAPPPATREEKEKLEKEFKPKLEAAQKKLAGEVARVNNVPGGIGALQEIRSVLKRKMK